MVKSKNRGNDIEFVDGIWVYSDTREPVAGNYKHRPCAHCGKPYTVDDHDGCLGELIGITNACCGHGNINQAYVQFYDGTTIHGEDAIKIQAILKANSHGNYNNEERLSFLKGSVKFYSEIW